MTFTVVIPTKNRPKELTVIFNSIITQTRIPDQIIIVDQSNKKNVIEEELRHLLKNSNLKLIYIHDESINGLVEAKATSLKYNSCDYISFFDDDIVLEKEYFDEIEKILKKDNSIGGLNGKILNYPKLPFLKKKIFGMTHIGIFKDNRINSQLNNSNSDKLILLTVLSGGLSTWNKSVFEKVKFDVINKFHSYEDQEFSIRVKKFISKKLFLAPNAKLYHNHSQINRLSHLKKYKIDIQEIFLIYRKNREIKFVAISLIILLFGLFFNAIFLCFQYKSMGVLINYFKGLRLGFKNLSSDE